MCSTIIGKHFSGVYKGDIATWQPHILVFFFSRFTVTADAGTKLSFNLFVFPVDPLYHARACQRIHQLAMRAQLRRRALKKSFAKTL